MPDSDIGAVLSSVAADMFQEKRVLSYLVGSAAVRGVENATDIDLILVDSLGKGERYASAIESFRRAIDEQRPETGWFCATDPAFQAFFENSLRRAAGRLHIRVTPYFVFGPTPPELGIGEDGRHSLHVCGPFAIADMPHLSRYLPFHTRAFLTANRPVVGPPLRDLLMNPEVDRREFEKWLEQLLRQLRGTANAVYRKRLVRNILFALFLYHECPDTYERISALQSAAPWERAKDEDLTWLAEHLAALALSPVLPEMTQLETPFRQVASGSCPP